MSLELWGCDNRNCPRRPGGRSAEDGCIRAGERFSMRAAASSAAAKTDRAASRVCSEPLFRPFGSDDEAYARVEARWAEAGPGVGGWAARDEGWSILGYGL